jgi:hypothetical protein
MLILTGGAEGFTAIENAHKAGNLSAAVGEKVIQFYIIHGATVQGESRVGAAADVSEAEGRNLLVGPGRKMTPPRFSGINVAKGEAGPTHFFFHRGDDAYVIDPTRAADYEKLTDYFKTSLAIRDDTQWVNLSAFESDRMLPKELSGTALGRTLLSQDCMLKRLTASFMHPDNAVGREYWNAVYAEARRRFGNSRMQFNSFQKVWIIPTEAAVYECDGDHPGDEPPGDDEVKTNLNAFMRGIDLAPGRVVAYILRNHLGVQCEADLLARKELFSRSAGPGVHAYEGESDFALNLFREIVLPRIEEEVNESEHFADIRQVYSAMILATWMKHKLPELGNSRFKLLADSGNPDGLNITIESIARIGIPEKEMVTAPRPQSEVHGDRKRINHATPFAPAFDVPENVEFFEIYVNLFRNGVFRCARNEAGDEPGERVTRIYFSGSIDLTRLRANLKVNSCNPMIWQSIEIERTGDIALACVYIYIDEINCCLGRM